MEFLTARTLRSDRYRVGTTCATTKGTAKGVAVWERSESVTFYFFWMRPCLL